MQTQDDNGEQQAAMSEEMSDDNDGLAAEEYTHPFMAFFVSLFITLLAGIVMLALMAAYLALFASISGPGHGDPLKSQLLAILIYFVGSALPSHRYANAKRHSRGSLWCIGIAWLLASLGLFLPVAAILLAGSATFH